MLVVCIIYGNSERIVNLVLDKAAFNSAAMIRARHLTCPGWYVIFLSVIAVLSLFLVQINMHADLWSVAD